MCEREKESLTSTSATGSRLLLREGEIERDFYFFESNIVINESDFLKKVYVILEPTTPA